MATWVQEKIKNWGEKVMDQMIDSFVANQDAHLSNLQQWNVAKFIDRTLKAKYFYKQPSTLNPPAISPEYILPDALTHKPIGVIHIDIENALLFFFGYPWKSSLKNSQFKLIIKFGKEKSFISGPHKIDQENKDMRVVLFNEKASQSINDLWSDIIIEVHCMRSPESEIIFDQFFNINTPTISIENILSSHDDHPTTKAPSGPSYQSSEGPLINGSKNPKSISSNLPSHQSSNIPSAHQKSSTHTPGNHKTHLSTLYGRAIIPLNIFLNSYEHQIDEDGQYVTSSQFWLHLYPNNNRLAENKFFRPLAGFEEFGMKHPRSTLGFIKVDMKFIWHTHPAIGPIHSNIYTPTSNWVIPPSPEPHLFESFIDRASAIITTPPRWLSKILPYADCKRNHYDWVCVSLFWLVLFYTFMLSTLLTLPLGLCTMCLLLSLTYRVGAEPAVPIGFYSNPSRRCEPLGRQTMVPHQLISLWTRLSDLTRPGQTSQGASPSSGNPNISSKASFKSRMMYNQISLKSTPPEHTKPNISPPLDSKNTSCIKSPFGDLDVHIRPSQLGKLSPIFSDDAGEPIISEQLQKLINLFTVIQIIAGHFAMACEKLRYALNWEDPYTTLLTYWTLIINTFFLSVIIYIVSLLPWWITRSIPFFLCIFFFQWMHSEWNDLRTSMGISGPNSGTKITEEMLSESSSVSDSQTSSPDHLSNIAYPDEVDDTSEVSNTIDMDVLSPQIIPRQALEQLRKQILCLFISIFSIFVNSPSKTNQGVQNSVSSSIIINLLLIFYQSILVFQDFLYNVCMYTSNLFNNLTIHMYLPLPIATLSWTFIYNWWMRIPDCREMDHRNICSTQLVSSLSQLLPADAMTIDPEEYLEEFFGSSNKKESIHLSHHIGTHPTPSLIATTNHTTPSNPLSYGHSILPNTGLYSDLLNLTNILDPDSQVNIEDNMLTQESSSSSNDTSFRKRSITSNQSATRKSSSDNSSHTHTHPQLDQIFTQDTYTSLRYLAQSAGRIFVRRTSKRDSLSRDELSNLYNHQHEDRSK